MNETDYSIVIPVYNEEKRIPGHIEQIFDFFLKQTGKIEVIFVNDGSKDGTEKVLKEYRQKYDFKLISYSENRGKGYAVKTGALNASGNWILFFDIDLATPLEYFNSIKEFEKEYGVVIGSRRVEGAKIQKSESAIRTFLGQGFTKLSNMLVPGIKDFTCGFKCFSKESASIIFKRALIDRWGFDTELLYIAKLHHIKIKQIPVTWMHDDRSRVKVFSAVWSSLRELAQMKSNEMRGKYK